MIIVRPNNSHRYQPIVESQRAIEPPLWHILCADYFSSSKVIDLEVDNRTIPIGSEIFILNTGNNPTAFGHDRLPMNPILYKPRWDLINLYKYKAHDWHAGNEPRSPYGVVYTSVSCPFQCKFCFSKDFYTTGYQERPLGDVISDFRYLGEKGVKHIRIIDEIFTLKQQRVVDICKEITRLPYKFNIWCYSRIDTINQTMLEYMKKAGFNWICYGIESGNFNIRKSADKGKFPNEYIQMIVKDTKDAGINVLGNFMFGFEEDNYKTMRETLDFADRLDCEHINFYCMVDKDVNQLAKDFVPRATKYLSAKEVLQFRDEAYMCYFAKRGKEVRRLERGR